MKKIICRSETDLTPPTTATTVDYQQQQQQQLKPSITVTTTETMHETSEQKQQPSTMWMRRVAPQFGRAFVHVYFYEYFLSNEFSQWNVLYGSLRIEIRFTFLDD